MKFTNLVYDVIVEEIKNKSTIQYLYKKWLGNDPSEEQMKSVEPYIKFFGQKRDSLSLKQAAVKAFLTKYNSVNGEFFDPRNLKDITKYTLEQIKSLYQEFYVDDVNNNESIKMLINKWYGDGDEPTEDEKFQGYKMITWFNNYRPQLSLESPEVLSFLHHYDGNEQSQYFDPNNLKDIKSYNLQQMSDLYHEFHDPTQEMRREDETFNEGGGMSTEAKRNASEKIWYSNDNVVVDEEGFKVHYIPDQRTAIKYGYYQQEVRNKMYGYGWNQKDSIRGHWCVTGRGSEDSWTNLWGRYRDQGKTFYLVLDESKKPEEGERATSGQGTSRYYLGALQNHGRNGWVLTSLLNDGDTDMTWEKIVSIYPQLAEHKDKLPSVAYDASIELNVDTNIVGRLYERPGPLQFAKQSPSVKKAYIDEGHPLKEPHSWETLNSYLRNLYIARTEEGNMYNSYSTTEFLGAIKKTPEFYTLLKNKITAICARTNRADIKDKGISVLYLNILNNSYKIERKSIDNENLILVKAGDGQPSGIWDLDKNDWATFDGIKYVNKYHHTGVELYIEKQGNQKYVVNVYTLSDDVDHTSFYALHPVTIGNQYGESHFITYNKFEELKSRIVPSSEEDDDEDFTNITNFNKDSDVDIKETAHFT